MEWLKNNPLVAGLIGLGIIILIVTAFAFFDAQNIREENNLKNQGATEERNRGNEEILNKVENAARPVDDDERRRECLRNNRNPSACN